MANETFSKHSSNNTKLLLTRQDSLNNKITRSTSDASDRTKNITTNNNNTVKDDSLNDSTDDDLTELDKLLDDLDSARKTLAMGSSISNSKSFRLNNETSIYHSEDLSTSSSLIPSPSLSSPNSCLTSKSPNSSFSTNLNDSISKRLINASNEPGKHLLSSDRVDCNNIHMAKTLNAAHELEKLMASLAMFKVRVCL